MAPRTSRRQPGGWELRNKSDLRSIVGASQGVSRGLPEGDSMSPKTCRVIANRPGGLQTGARAMVVGVVNSERMTWHVTGHVSGGARRVACLAG